MQRDDSVRYFGRDRAMEVLRSAGEARRTDVRDAKLLRLGENAIFGCRAGATVVRIARSMDRWDDAKKEVLASEWLNVQGVRAVRALYGPQPLAVSGHPVTFWEYVDGRPGGPSDVRRLGEILSVVHEVDSPDDPLFPPFDPLSRVAARIERSPVPLADKSFLEMVLREVSADLARVDYAFSPSVVHGDAHVQNLMITSDGSPILIDLENVAIGQREWDLAVTATEWKIAGFWTDKQYHDFVESYGFDVTSWSGFEILWRAQAIKMTTWLMQNVNESDAIREEYQLRMRTIRDGAPLRCWTPF